MEKRTLAIGTEYRAAAKSADLRNYDMEEGPISQRLASLIVTGASFGRFGECSDSVLKLVAVMAKARVEQQTLAWGRVQEYFLKVTY